MTKYDALDARKQLEQEITKDLKDAFAKRGFTVKHNGTPDSHAPAGKPDIEFWNYDMHVNVEVTKTTKSSSQGEMLSISDHLNKKKKEFMKKSCFVLYVSPETHYRMISGIKDYNLAHKNKDQKIIPICFSTFELMLKKLSNIHKDIISGDDLQRIFIRFEEFGDDEQILSIIQEELFPEDLELKKDIADREIIKHTQLEQELFSELEKIENKLRESGIAVGAEAIKNLIYLVFMKLYQEKKSKNGKNYFTEKNFYEFQQAHGQSEKKRAIHKLFEIMREDDKEFEKSGLFTKSDHLAETLDDDFVLENIIIPLEKFRFYAKKIDGLGAAYEVLALRSSKDVKTGQFFTPKNVVQFMVKLAELETSDTILDPACGTGRFLIWAMDEMIKKVSGKDSTKTENEIRTNQLYGSDIDQNVAKLAKMNMYIHDDGKTNVWYDDGLLLYKRDLDSTIDVILTNPPLGKMNYKKKEYDEDFITRMEVIPRSSGKSTKSKDKEPKITGNVMKGGALFLNACYHYLKDVRDQNTTVEWKGGKLLIILDEGILNTDDYKKVRQFIRSKFYIKAIISLTTDTFIPVSKTPTKTSIIYAIKKDDPTAQQLEPIFYAHASKVGMDTKKRLCPNYLINETNNNILSEYLSFKNKVLSCYTGLKFNRKKFDLLKGKSGLIETE